MSKIFAAFCAALTLAPVLLVIIVVQYALQPAPAVLATQAPAADAPHLGGIA